MNKINVLRRQIKAWLGLSRPAFHTVGIFPFLLGVVLAWSRGYVLNWAVLALSTLAVVLIMLMTYWSGEYYDYETDSINVDYNVYSGGTRVLTNGLLPRRHAIIGTYIALFLAVLIGLVLQFYYKTGVYTIPLGAFGLLCGYFYTGKPVQWAYLGIGEVLIGICYGWLTVNTGYYLQTGHFSIIGTIISIPLIISIFLVILINEFPDYAADKAVGKRNLVVRFGKDRMAFLYALLLTICYLVILGGLLFGVPWFVGPLSLLVLPLVIWNILAIKGRGFEQAKTLEGVCARTILFHLFISIIFITTFFIKTGVLT